MPHALFVALASTVLMILAAAPTVTRAATSTAGGRGLTATSVVVGGLTAEPPGQGADLGARARFARARNVGGRRVEYLGAGAPDDAPAVARLTEEAFAVVPAVGVTSGVETLAGARLPLVGVASPEWVGNRWSYGITGAPPSARSATAGPAWGVQLRALLGGSRGNAVTVVTGDDAASVARGADARASLRAAGFRVSAPLAVVPPVDPTSVARQLVAGVVPPPAAVLLLAGATTSRSIAQQLAALGYTGTVGVGDELYTPTTPAVGVGLTALTTIAPLEADTASLHQMVDDVRAVDPAAVITPSVEQGYFAADFFLAVLRRVGRRLDVARFQAVANGGRFSYEVARTVGRSTWPAMHTDSVPCGALAQSDGVGYTVIEPYRCDTPVPRRAGHDR